MRAPGDDDDTFVHDDYDTSESIAPASHSRIAQAGVWALSLLLAALFVCCSQSSSAIKITIPAGRYPPAKCLWSAAPLAIITARRNRAWRRSALRHQGKLPTPASTRRPRRQPVGRSGTQPWDMRRRPWGYAFLEVDEYDQSSPLWRTLTHLPGASDGKMRSRVINHDVYIGALPLRSPRPSLIRLHEFPSQNRYYQASRRRCENSRGCRVNCGRDGVPADMRGAVPIDEQCVHSFPASRVLQPSDIQVHLLHKMLLH